MFFRGFLSLQKIKFMFFEFLNIASAFQIVQRRFHAFEIRVNVDLSSSLVLIESTFSGEKTFEKGTATRSQSRQPIFESDKQLRQE